MLSPHTKTSSTSVLSLLNKSRTEIAGFIVLNSGADGDRIAKIAGVNFDLRHDKVVAHYGADEQFLGGLIYTDYTYEAVAIHTGAVSPYWVNRDMIFVGLDYPFNVLGVKRIFGYIPEDNQHALAFNRKLGCREVARIEGVYTGDRACIVMRMDRADCRLLNIRPHSFERWYQ